MSNTKIASRKNDPIQYRPPTVVRTEPARPNPDHIRAIDGVRGLAIFAVMLLHGASGTQAVGTFERAVLSVLTTGWAGVDLFFVISGFLITGLLLKAVGHARYFSSFYARRALRIFPLYYGFLVLLVVVAPLVAPGVLRMRVFQSLHDSQLWFWTYSVNLLVSLRGNWDPAAGGVANHFWSLAVEEQFYLIWPVVVLLCSPRRLMQVCVAVIVGALLIRAALFPLSDYAIAGYTLLPARADGLALGALLAAIAHTRGGLQSLVPLARRAVPVLIALLVAIGIAVGTLNPYSGPVQTIGFTLVALLSGAIVVLATSGPHAWKRAFEARWLMGLGKYSYGLYVFHFPTRYILHTRGLSPMALTARGLPPLAAALAATAILIAVSIPVALVSWHLFEKHFMKLKRWVPRPGESVEASASVARAARQAA